MSQDRKVWRWIFSIFLCFSIFYVHFSLFVPEKRGENVFCKQRKNSKEVIQTARTQFRHPASSMHHHYNYRYTFFSIFRITVIMISDRTGKNLCGTVIQQIQLRGQPFHYITSEILSWSSIYISADVIRMQLRSSRSKARLLPTRQSCGKPQSASPVSWTRS